MGFILVIARNSNLRKFCVDNLVVRGFVAVGVATVLNDGKALLEQDLPDLIVMWGLAYELEPDLIRLRSLFKDELVIVVVSNEPPAPEWLVNWKISGYIPRLADSRKMIDQLHPWLKVKPAPSPINDDLLQPD